MAAQDTHGAAVAVFIAVERHSRRTADIYESVGSKAQAAFGNNGGDRVAFVFRFNGRISHQQLDAAAQEQFFDRGLDFIDIVKSSVFMTGKIHGFVSCNGFHNCKQVACAHGDTFFGGSIAAVVAENPADQPCA